MVKIKSFNFGYRFSVLCSRSCCPLWSVVEAYAGERAYFYIKFNWPFLGADFLPKVYHILLNYGHRYYCSLPYISSEATKKNGMFMSNK
jgi:hypothetical protein